MTFGGNIFSAAAGHRPVPDRADSQTVFKLRQDAEGYVSETYPKHSEKAPVEKKVTPNHLLRFLFAVHGTSLCATKYE